MSLLGLFRSKARKYLQVFLQIELEVLLVVVGVDVAEVLQRLVVRANDREHALQSSQLVHRGVSRLVRVRNLRKT